MMSADRQTEEAGPYLQAAHSTLTRNFLPVLWKQESLFGGWGGVGGEVNRGFSSEVGLKKPDPLF